MRIPIPCIIVPLVVLLLYIFLPGVRERPWTAVRVVGVIVAVLGYVLAFIARVQLGKAFAIRPQAKELVRHGLYSRIRNPIYVFVDVSVFGLILALQLYWLFVIFPFFIAVQARQAHKEAKVLHEKFCQSYLDYRHQTWF